MPEEFDVKQTQGDFKKVYESLDKLGQRELRSELRKSLAAQSKPARMRIRDSQREYFPRGMQKKYARVPAQAMGTSGHQISLKWKQRIKGTDYKSLNRGRLRHPLWGNKNYWYNQAIPAGFFDQSVAKELPEMKQALVRDLAEKVDRAISG